MKRAILAEVDQKRLAQFLRNRACGCPQAHLSTNEFLYPAFEPGKKKSNGVLAPIAVETREEGAVATAIDVYGHGTYGIFDIRTTTKVRILTCSSNTLVAERNPDGTFTVTITVRNVAGNLTDWWGGNDLPWEDYCPETPTPLVSACLG